MVILAHNIMYKGNNYTFRNASLLKTHIEFQLTSQVKDENVQYKYYIKTH